MGLFFSCKWMPLLFSVSESIKTIVQVIPMTKLDSSESQWWFDIYKSTNVIYHINKRKDKIHMIISIDAEKAFDTTQNPFIIKVLTKMSAEETYLSIIKGIYDKPIANIILDSEKLKTFPVKSATRQGCPLSQLLFSTVLEVLTTTIRQGKEIKYTQIDRGEIKLSLYEYDVTSHIENCKDSTQRASLVSQW